MHENKVLSNQNQNKTKKKKKRFSVMALFTSWINRLRKIQKLTKKKNS